MMMERILLGLLCLSGWNISCLLHQYHYVADRMSWTEAQTHCRQRYTDLATIENNEEMTQLINAVSSVGSKVTEVWIGLYSQIDWKWSGGYRGKGTEYRKWDNYDDNEPDFLNPSQLCVSVYKDGGWWDRNCSLEWPFICYRGTQLDPEFVLVNKTMTWSSAQSYCRKNFTDLATVRNHTENQEILRFGWKGNAWIGLFRDPDDRWSDGSESTFRHWYAGPHQIGDRSVVCGAADLSSSGQWKLLPCETRLTFVCYSRLPPPVMRQVVKLRIRGDSSVDLNNPAVKADIMKKLQDRLQESGLSGVTLKWREQPDGNVFHKEGKSCQENQRKRKCSKNTCLT